MELHPLAREHAERLLEIRSTPEVAAWWHQRDDGFPYERDQTATRLTVLHGGEIVGLVQFEEDDDPDYRNAWIDVFIAPTHHRRGLGSDALTTLARHLIEQRGHHRLVIDPAAENAVAIRCYEKVGFRAVGVMRQYERDPGGGWRDGLLMEYLASDH